MDAYLRDVQKLQEYISMAGLELNPGQVSYGSLQGFIIYLNKIGLGDRSQARILSGIRKVNGLEFLPYVRKNEKNEDLKSFCKYHSNLKISLLCRYYVLKLRFCKCFSNEMLLG